MADVTLPATKMITLDDLMKLGSDARVEVINGELVDMSPVGGLHHIIVGNINRILDAYVLAHETGAVFVDGLLYLMHSDRRGLTGAYVPDVSFLRKESIPADWDISTPFPGAPDLAVEVMSPGDSATLALEKVRGYLQAGTEQVWVVYPQQRELHQYRRSDADTVRVYREGERIDAEAIFPGIELSADVVFKLPRWAQG
jgi:Uma2 family endonuclease